MIRELPKAKYSGLTIVYSFPSRKDIKGLGGGYAGIFFGKCLPYSASSCDIRTADTIGQGLLDGTKAILLLGEHAMHKWTKGYERYTIGEQRGCPLDNQWRLPCIASYQPQECIDAKGEWEQRYNPLYKPSSLMEDKKTDEKRHGATQRHNYKFWLKMDTRKICSVLPGYKHQILAAPKQDTIYKIYPRAQDVIDILTSTTNDELYFDIETDPDLNIRCFAFAFSEGPVYVVPCINFDYRWAYADLPFIYRALSIAFQRNRVIAHNTMFDLFVMAYKMGIGFRDAYDTMLAFARCFVDIEKSLGHALSVFTWEPFHKAEGIYDPQNEGQQMSLWVYNGKDVSSMRTLRKQIDLYASSRKGLTASIAEVNSSIKPYLTNTLFGIRFNEERRVRLMSENDRMMEQIRRMIRLCVGYDMLPTSNKALPNYLFKEMQYKRMGFTKTGNDASDEVTLRKLALSHPDNIVIKMALRYKQIKKETGSLKFNPWKSSV